MAIARIRSKVRIFNHPEHGKRILFVDGPTNPRDQLGKLGVDFHTAAASGFRNCVPAYVTVMIDEQNRETEQTIYFNRASLIKYLCSIKGVKKEILRSITLGAYHSPNDFRIAKNNLENILSRVDDSTLMRCVDVAMDQVRVNKFSGKTNQILHAEKNILFKKIKPKGRTSQFFDWFSKKLSDAEIALVKKPIQIARSIEFSKRALHVINAFQFQGATALTTYQLNRKLDSVFISDADLQKTLNNLEAVYSAEQKKLNDAIVAFILKHKTLTNLPHAQLVRLQEDLIKLVNRIIGHLLDKQHDAAVLLFENETMSQPLRKYKKEIFELINHFNKNKKQIVLAGQPSFLKSVVDAVSKKGDSFAKYYARGIASGQAMSEAFRDDLIRSGFLRINSFYSASKLEMNVAAETEIEVRLRKAIEFHPGLDTDLYGKGKDLPMIFHYDPLHYQVRYNAGDEGRVYTASDVEAVLVKHGITDIKPRNNLSYLFVWNLFSSSQKVAEAQPLLNHEGNESDSEALSI